MLVFDAAVPSGVTLAASYLSVAFGTAAAAGVAFAAASSGVDAAHMLDAS